MELPDACMTMILSWLPAKSLIKLQGVNKDMFELIRDPYLQHLHADRVRIGVSILNFSGSKFEIIPVDNTFALPTEALSFLKEDNKQILGSCNGLIIYRSISGDMRVLNPLTKKLSIVSSPPGVSLQDVNKKLSVCFYHAINREDYRIICVISEYKLVVETLKLFLEFWQYSSAGTWEKIAQFYSNCFEASIKQAVFVNGVVYWLAISAQRQLNSFNIETKTSERVTLPEKVSTEISSRTQLAIAPWRDESLSLIENQKREDQIVIWVRSSACSSQTEWVRVHQVNLNGIGLKGPAHYRAMLFDGSLVVSVNNTMHICSPYKPSSKVVGKFKETELCVVKPYIGTFRSCGKEEQSVMKM